MTFKFLWILFRGVIYGLNMIFLNMATFSIEACVPIFVNLHLELCVKLILFRNMLCTFKIMLREEDFKSHLDFFHIC
jgi:hypothetical protein